MKISKYIRTEKFQRILIIAIIVCVVLVIYFLLNDSTQNKNKYVDSTQAAATDDADNVYGVSAFLSRAKKFGFDADAEEIYKNTGRTEYRILKNDGGDAFLTLITENGSVDAYTLKHSLDKIDEKDDYTELEYEINMLRSKNNRAAMESLKAWNKACAFALDKNAGLSDTAIDHMNNALLQVYDAKEDMTEVVSGYNICVVYEAGANKDSISIVVEKLQVY